MSRWSVHGECGAGTDSVAGEARGGKRYWYALGYSGVIVWMSCLIEVV